MTKLYLETDLQSFDLRQALALISPERRQKALAFKFERGQRECAMAYLLLKKALREVYGIDENPFIIEDKHGKPLLRDYPHIHFNISHCREAVACVVGDEPVGVDVEAIREYKPELANYVLNAEELLAVQTAANPAEAFIRFWTRKEALLKLTGIGITTDLKTVLPNPDIRLKTSVFEKFICTIATYNGNITNTISPAL